MIKYIRIILYEQKYYYTLKKNYNIFDFVKI